MLQFLSGRQMREQGSGDWLPWGGWPCPCPQETLSWGVGMTRLAPLLPGAPCAGVDTPLSGWGPIPAATLPGHPPTVGTPFHQDSLLLSRPRLF